MQQTSFPSSSMNSLFILLDYVIHVGRNLFAAHGLYRPTHERPASATNRESRPGVGVATGARYMRDGVTGSAYTERPHPSLALGLDSTEAGYQMEKVIPHITLPQLFRE
jgi:hypothetical protein